ncbi:MAG: hypothetical protein MUO27_01325 [Sedimentisphaerales bacterium]|nr:hypothetical protein [Sedimentisphaerales bacterium]
MARTKYCRIRNKNVEIADGPFSYICAESYPTSNACEQSKCIYHNVMGMASAIGGMLGGGPSSSREDFIKTAILRFGAIDYCEEARREPVVSRSMTRDQYKVSCREERMHAKEQLPTTQRANPQKKWWQFWK